MNSILLWIGGLLVAVLGLLFAVPYFVDWNSYRGVFEEEASRVLGREVRLGGAVNLRLLPAPYVRFEKLRIANADGRTGEPLFRADAFTLWLSLGPLLRGAVEAKELELDHPVLRLSTAADGTGNWQSFKIAPGALPFVPSDVALQSVKVRDGTVVLDTGAGPSMLGKINGELEAGALAGPYRARLDAVWEGSPREIRLATAAQEPDGSVRTKLTVRVPQSGNTYGFEGTMADLWGRLHFEGTGTARLMLGAARKDDAFEVHSAIKGDMLSADLTDVEVAYEKGGKPQSISGEVHAQWARAPRVTTSWQAKWLDLDGLAAGGDGGGQPLAVAKDLAEQAAAWVPASGEVRATLDVEQVNVGGDAVTGLRLAASGADGLLRVEELRGSLPGGARVDLKGSLAAQQSARAFDGDVVLRGSSLQRFLVWAAGADGGDLGRADGPFLLAGGLGVSASRVTLKDADLELGAARVHGTLDYSADPQPGLTLQVAGDVVDLGAFAPGMLAPPALMGLFADEPSQTTGQAVGLRRLIAATRRNLKLAVKAGELKDGARTLRDVDASLAAKGQALDISALKFTTAAGARIELEGAVTEVAAAPKGVLRGSVVASSAEAVGDLKELLGTSGLVQLLPSAVSDGKAAVTVALGQRAPLGVDVRIDGSIGGNRVIVRAAADGGVKNWRTGAIDLYATAEGPDARRLLQLLPGASGVLKDAAGAQRAARLDVSAAGPSASALGVIAEFKSDPLTASFSGKARIGETEALDLDGEASLAVANVADVLDAYGVKRPPALAGVAVDGALGVRRDMDGLVIEPRGLEVGGSAVSGTVKLGSGSAGQIALDGDLRADKAALAGLLRLIGDGRSALARAPADADSWQDVPLDLAVLEGVEGKITFAAGELSLVPGVSLAPGRIAATFGAGGVEVTALDGVAMAGQVSAQGALRRGSPGVMLSVDVKADALQLAQLGFAGPARAKGTVAAAVHLDGRALTPRALVASLGGQGELRLQNAALPGLSPDRVAKVAREFLDGSDAPAAGALVQRLKAAADDAIPLDNRTVAVQIADGAVKVAPIVVERPGARARNVTTLDLTTMRVDSEWRIEVTQPDAKRASKTTLPAISIVHVAPLATIAATEGRLDADALERELTVVRMERDVERLDRQRREDAERARAIAPAPLPVQGSAPQSNAQPAPSPIQPAEGDAATARRPGDDTAAVTPASGDAGEVTSGPIVRPQPAPRPAPRRVAEPPWQEKITGSQIPR